MFWVLRLLLGLCGVAIVGLPFLITQFINDKQWIFAGAFGTLEVVALYGSMIVNNAIAREDFTRWSSVVKRAYGNLEAAHRLAGFARRESVRITLFVRHRRKKDSLVQITPYYPTGHFGSFRRYLSVAKGIVGMCYRTGQRQMQVVTRNADYREELISKWGFTAAEAVKISTDKRAFLALPVIRRDETVGAVVFLDAKSPSAFNSAARVRIFQKVCVAIAEWA
jgi:hypothetical protein